MFLSIHLFIFKPKYSLALRCKKLHIIVPIYDTIRNHKSAVMDILDALEWFTSKIFGVSCEKTIHHMTTMIWSLRKGIRCKRSSATSDNNNHIATTPITIPTKRMYDTERERIFFSHRVCENFGKPRKSIARLFPVANMYYICGHRNKHK